MAERTSIRTLSADDWQRWRALRLAALRQAPYAFGATVADWSGANDSEGRWRERLRSGHNVIAYLGRTPVGMVSGVPTDDVGAAGLISMWVDPAARGHGIGDALVEAVIEWARSTPAEFVRLSVFPDNEHAVGLYRRHRFVRDEADRPPQPHVEVTMSRRLDDDGRHSSPG